MSTITLSRESRRRPLGSFLRHLVEMTLAMMLGMFVYGALVGTIAGAAGSSFETIRVGRPELFVLGMAFSMSVPMVAWMRYRAHTWRSSAEMTAAMFVPALALILCYRLNGIAAGSVCPLACATMIPAMIVAMLYRLDVYTQHVISPRGAAT
jgi:hypothetical protein